MKHLAYKTKESDKGKRKHTSVWMIILTTVLGVGANAYAQERVRLSLDPYAALLEDGASLISGFNPPIRLPANVSTPNFSLGFTIPNDYKPNTPLALVILWASPATQCNFALRSNFLFLARAGSPRDGRRSVADGLDPVNASTSFSLISPQTIVMAASATSRQTERVRFDITAAGFAPTLQSGDAVDFGIFREDRSAADTCAQDLGIAGVSVVYQARP